MKQKMIVVDSLSNLPENPYKCIVDNFEYCFAVKWYAILVYNVDELIGYMNVFRNPDDSSKWYFGDVHTKAGYRRQHVASHMYDQALELVKKYEKSFCIEASIHPENAASIKLHEKYGFVNSHIKSTFADFAFEPEETMHYLYFVSIYPSKNNEMSREQLKPLWERYVHEFKNGICNETTEQALNMRLNQTEDGLHMDRIWAGDNLIGFIYHSCDQEMVKRGNFEKEQIKDYYILPEWRKDWANCRIV